MARQLSIAVVEDNPHIRQLLQDEIHDEGHRMIGYSNAEDFLAAYGDEPIDLILLDLMLPGMDGLSCLQRLRLNPSQDGCPRVVIVTALDDAEKRRIALENGAEEYILKPDLFLRLPDLLQSGIAATEEAGRHP